LTTTGVTVAATETVFRVIAPTQPVVGLSVAIALFVGEAHLTRKGMRFGADQRRKIRREALGLHS
jgi:hypothetical protein